MNETKFRRRVVWVFMALFAASLFNSWGLWQQRSHEAECALAHVAIATTAESDCSAAISACAEVQALQWQLTALKAENESLRADCMEHHCRLSKESLGQFLQRWGVEATNGLEQVVPEQPEAETLEAIK